MKKSKLNVTFKPKEPMQMCNFELSKSEHAKLKKYLKSHGLKKCDFFRQLIQQLP